MAKLNELSDQEKQAEIEKMKESISALKHMNKLVKKLSNDPEVIARRDQYLKEHPKNENF